MRALVIAILFPLALGVAAAAQTTDPTGPGGCSVKIDPVDFGTYSIFSPDPDLAVGRIEIRCNNTALSRVTRVTFSSGFSGQATDRYMTNGSAQLGYNLYTDPARTRILGEGPGQGLGLSPAFIASTRPTAPFPLDRVVFRVYGEVPAKQLAPPGDYIDVIQIMIEF